MREEDKELTRRELYDKYTRSIDQYSDNNLTYKEEIYVPLVEDRIYNVGELKEYVAVIESGTLGEDFVYAMLWNTDEIVAFEAGDVAYCLEGLSDDLQARLIYDSNGKFRLITESVMITPVEE